MLRRIALALFLTLAGLGVLGYAVACGYVALPFGLTVNFPGFSGDAIPETELAQRIQLPPGFHINTYASGIPNARFMAFTPIGDLLVSAPREGAIYLVERDADGDGVADAPPRVLLGRLNQPHGLAIHREWLYVAEADGVFRIRFDPETHSVIGRPERIITGLPAGGNHWTRTVVVGPDEQLYVSVGSSCNACVEDDARRAAILRFGLDGSGEQLYATGLRNSVGLAFEPQTGALYATDNGRDLLGDDFPPCELNRVVEGGFYGWPYAHGNRVPDPDLGADHADRIAASLPPAHAFGAHTAPLGIAFYVTPPTHPPTAFPPPWDQAAYVAQHGSWNRSRKSGYQVVALFFDADGGIREEPFATGFVRADAVAGRPVDVAVGPDGALYISDDFTGAIYRVAYGQAARADAVAPPTAAHGDPL
ncbi:MAG: PQQ-dependent sugar dehydrogenase, partial [Deltaproteobacteria bacterium]|nr:PQQ-dependent sugar dehydrogenase [Deltaproteobacteria bacterium]